MGWTPPPQNQLLPPWLAEDIMTPVPLRPRPRGVQAPPIPKVATRVPDAPKPAVAPMSLQATQPAATQSPDTPIQTPTMAPPAEMPIPQSFSPEERKQMAASQIKYEALAGEQMKKQRGQIDQMRQNLLEYKTADPGFNLAPLAAYVDFLNKGKSNMLAGYQQSGLMPESPAERQTRIQQMEQGISRAEDKLTSQEIDILKANLMTQKSGMNMRGMLRYQSSLANRQFRQYQDARNFKSKTEKGIMDAQYKAMGKDFNEKRATLANLEGMLSPDPITGKVHFQDYGAALSLFSRAIAGEKGVLTDRDITRIAPKSGARDAAGVLAYFKSMPDEDLPADFTARMLDMVQTVKKNMVKTKLQELDRQQSAYRAMPSVQNTGLMGKDQWGMQRFEETRELISSIHPDFNLETKKIETKEAPKAAPTPGAAGADVRSQKQQLQNEIDKLRKEIGQ